MATKRVSLPALKVTKRPAHGKKAVTYFKRKVGKLEKSFFKDLRKERASCSDGDASCLEDYMQASTHTTVNEPTCHELESRALIAGWENIRHTIRAAISEAAALPLFQICLLCESPATMRCAQCGPKGYYCQECFLSSHASVNIFHAAEIWKVGSFIVVLITVYDDNLDNIHVVCLK